VLTSNTTGRTSSNLSITGLVCSNTLSSIIHAQADHCLPLRNRDESSHDDDSLGGSLSLPDIIHTAAQSTKRDNPTPDAVDPEAPIQVSPKPPKGKKRKNVFINDRGFPDQSDEIDTLMHSLDGGPLLRKRCHPAPAFDNIDPTFNHAYDEALHGAQFKEEFKPSPLLSDSENKELEELIKQFWCVVDHRGLSVPVKDYLCHINTGTARPIAVKGINYGPYKTPIMRKCIAKLEQLGHISQISEGPWLFKALGA
jgi:hypothetical protein